MSTTQTKIVLNARRKAIVEFITAKGAPATIEELAQAFSVKPDRIREAVHSLHVDRVVFVNTIHREVPGPLGRTRRARLLSVSLPGMSQALRDFKHAAI
jgi:hypothetical protein